MSLQLLIAMAPMVLVIVLIVGLRKPAHLSSLAGLALVIVTMSSVPAFRVGWPVLGQTTATTLLLLANAAWVMFAGVYLNQILSARGVQARLAAWISALPLSRESKVALIIVGVAPAVEAMTGFGVSLFVTLPVLLVLSSRPIALRQAMLSVNIMPWGTLGLATIVGAALSGYPLPHLGIASAVVSFLIFPAFAVIAVRLMGAGAPLAWVAATGLLFSSALLFINYVGVIEIAGVLAGFFTVAVALVAHRSRFVPGKYPAIPWSSLVPYGFTLALIVVLRMLTATNLIDLDGFTLAAGNSRFNPVTSPGLALLVTALLMRGGRVAVDDAVQSLHKLRRPVLTLVCFIAMAQLMNVTGMISMIGKSVATAGQTGILFATPALAMLSGFLTGSNLGANALMMPLQMTIAQITPGADILFAAVQNSGAGHAVFTSLPNILLILMIAGVSNDSNEESGLLRFGIKTMGLVYLLLLAGGYLLSVTLLS